MTETHGYLSFQATLVNDLNELNPLCPRIIKGILCGTKISPLSKRADHYQAPRYIILPKPGMKKKPSPLVL